jgi:hypothetical protein
VISAPGQRDQLLLGAAVSPVVLHTGMVLTQLARAVRHLADEKFGLRAPEIDTEALGQPSGVAHVVGMKVRDDHLRDRTTTQVSGEDLLPQGADVGQAHAGVDDRPPRPVLEQPQVDVIELEGQRHPEPRHTGRDFDRRTGSGRLGPRIFDRHANQCTRA